MEETRTVPSIIPTGIDAKPRPASMLARIGRRLMLRQLRELKHGELRILETDGTEHRFGVRSLEFPHPITIHAVSPQVFADTAFGGTVGAGEAYIRGDWRADDLSSVVRLFVRNRELMNGLDSRWAMISRPLLKLFHWANRNTRAGSRDNIAAHYDLGNPLYELMLDETMAYSCAIFRTQDATLRDAQIEKFDSVCRKLELEPTDHLLEIGTGWGGLAIHAARHYGCRVTTTTISTQQREYAIEKIARAGLSDRITVLGSDYRDLQGRFDKLVSIEMIEAVGADHLDVYFAKCSSLLAPHGAMLLQAITLQDQHYAQALRSVDFIQRFVFPGSFIPSITAIANAALRVTDLKIFHLEDIGPHYARTLRIWRERFFQNLSAVRQLGYPDSFVRLWDFYLCYCEGGFAERQLGDVQMLLTKPGNRRAALAI